MSEWINEQKLVFLIPSLEDQYSNSAVFYKQQDNYYKQPKALLTDQRMKKLPTIPEIEAVRPGCGVGAVSWGECWLPDLGHTEPCRKRTWEQHTTPWVLRPSESCIQDSESEPRSPKGSTCKKAD